MRLIVVREVVPHGVGVEGVGPVVVGGNLDVGVVGGV